MSQGILWPAAPARTPENLLTSALAIIDAAFAAGAVAMVPLFSGGHDSLSACFVASHHPRFTGEVHHIDTGIGAKATRSFIDDVCREYGWTLRVYQSRATYERFVRRLGFPGPGSHAWIYQWVKDRCVGEMTRSPGARALISGARQQESTRRMGHTVAVRVGETSKTTGKVTKRKRIWTAPCYDWSSTEQRAFLDAWALPRNPVKLSPLGMSGECFCGAFARPGELDLIRAFAPDVAEEIDRLQAIAREKGKHCVWGTRRPKERGVIVAQTGPLCSSCDRKASASGLLFAED